MPEKSEVMSREVWVRMWGDYTLSSRPEMKVERCSYDVVTPPAARGMLKTIYWHPGMWWAIGKIYMREPIQFTSIRRDEVKSKILVRNVLSAMNGGGRPLYISSRREIVQGATILLRDVEYVAEAYFEMTPKVIPGDNEGKFKDIIMRRLRKGEYYHRPYFGCREFPAQFTLHGEDGIGTVYTRTRRNLGYVLFNLDYSNTKDVKPMFLRAAMKDGILDARNCEAVR